MIFDSDVIVWGLRGNKRAAITVDMTEDRVISIVSVIEVYQGARSKSELREIQKFLRQLDFRVSPLSESIGIRAAAIVEEHSLASGIELGDALIAATALDAAESLCTGNLKHFRPIKNLSCIPFRP